MHKHSKKHQHRGRRHAREARRELGPARGLLARTIDRVRAWFGDEDADRRLRLDEDRRRGEGRRDIEARPAPREERRGGGGRRRADRMRGGYPLSFVPSPQVWPWQFMGRGSPWPPGPESYYQQLLPPGVRGRPLGRRGRHTGRGPRGYVRPDARIVEDINEALTYSPHIDASDIEIRVDQGEVTVSGTVDDRFIKRLVEDLIEDVSGVRDVQNNLRVEKPALHGAGGMNRAGPRAEPFARRRDLTVGQDFEELEASNLNTGKESCARDRGGSFTGT